MITSAHGGKNDLNSFTTYSNNATLIEHQCKLTYKSNITHSFIPRLSILYYISNI